VTEPEPHPQGAIRLTFAYEGTEVRLLSRQTFTMVLPPTDPLDGLEGQSGFWYELRDAGGRPLYRRIVRNPIQHHIEVHEAESDFPSRRMVEAPQGVFTALVPDLAEAQTLVLCSSPFTSVYGPVADLAKFSLRG
jgi:hypothetical protein